MSFNIVLVEPEIPHNTGSIARTCALTKTRLHLVRPLGFSVADKYLKRAGLDYWHLVNICYYDSLQEVISKHPDNDFYFATTKTENLYTDFKYKKGSFFVFGKETKGLDKTILNEYRKETIKIPMIGDLSRSLNLSNSVNIVLFEALRQLDFIGLK